LNILSVTKKLIRANFRAAVFARDKDRCVTCGASNTILDAHHITDRNELPNGGYILENGISLCEKCHIKAESYHINKGKSWEKGYHPDDLYKLINSSKEIATKFSLKACK
jgi:5-methylcytosine-specific restriction endonuclease McrA